MELFFILGEPDCSGRGTCIRDKEEEQSVCSCNLGFIGDDCSVLFCPGEPTCSNHGKIYKC